jgi:predicted 2-oxoglutarate/Fe(II)-dependent dioxygenase YbiX
MLIEDVLPVDVCDAVLNEYVTSPDWKYAEVVNRESPSATNLDSRNCKVIYSSAASSIAKNQSVRAALDNAFFVGSSKAINTYVTKFGTCAVDKDSGYDILKYEVGGFFKPHIDSKFGINRIVSCSFALNDNFTGGEFAFFGQKVKYTVPKGAALLFPSNFLYPHEVLPVTNGTRYSVVTWFN